MEGGMDGGRDGGREGDYLVGTYGMKLMHNRKREQSRVNSL